MNAKKLLSNYIFKATLIFVFLIMIYACILYFSKGIFGINNCVGSFKLNEFGDFIGGVLNPLFALLSTAAILFLTYFIAKNESKKADVTLETQKQITLNQMRQEALNSISEKLNLFVYQSDKLNIYELNKGKFHEMFLTNLIKEKEKDKEHVIVWIIILSELENFQQLEYLFKDLFDKPEFSSIYKSLDEVVSELSNQQASKKIINSITLTKFIDLRQKFIISIGEFILQNFK